MTGLSVASISDGKRGGTRPLSECRKHLILRPDIRPNAPNFYDIDNMNEGNVRESSTEHSISGLVAAGCDAGKSFVQILSFTWRPFSKINPVRAAFTLLYMAAGRSETHSLLRWPVSI